MLFYHWNVQLAPERTLAAYAKAPSLDPSCCPACAALLAAVDGALLPPPVVQLLHAAGADPRKPGEAWGAPDRGFLSAWWVFGGSVSAEGWTGEGSNAVAEPAQGFRCWLETEQAGGPHTAFGDFPLVRLECAWEGDAFVALENAP